MTKNLWVVMPVYNEEESIASVIAEWLPALENSGLNYTFLTINDGSQDNSLKILNKLAAKHPRLQVIDKQNSGHGQSCIYGYRYALDNGATWIMQIDSDGQCDPAFFPNFIAQMETAQCIYGYRKKRDDGLQRVIISHFVTIFTMMATGIWVRDPNVPYRLIHSDIMRQISTQIPADFHLANIFVSVLSAKLSRIVWVPIHFRQRTGGVPSVKTFSFVLHGLKLFKQLREARLYGVAKTSD